MWCGMRDEVNIGILGGGKRFSVNEGGRVGEKGFFGSMSMREK